MRNEEIPKIKEMILETLGDDCEQNNISVEYSK
jgi:hypothetical protein